MSSLTSGVPLVLLHSPLVPRMTVAPLAAALDAFGREVLVPQLLNERSGDESHFDHHIEQIHRMLRERAALECVVVVAHSGAGALLGALSEVRVSACVMLDAIFPVNGRSRFELFDDPSAIERWRSMARKHGGSLPAAAIAAMGEQIHDTDQRAEFVSRAADVPLALYEEVGRVLPSWPGQAAGLYELWTPAYRNDADRAARAGFTVDRRAASHFELVNDPQGVAGRIVDFLRALEDEQEQ